MTFSPNGWEFFYTFLYVSIYAELQILIQLPPAILTKLCHSKHHNTVHTIIMFKMSSCPP